MDRECFILPWLFIDHPPLGEAPKEIRRRWVGCVLPLDPFKPFSNPLGAVGVITGQPVASNGSYRVPIKRALEILGLKHPEAVEWWNQNLTLNRAGSFFNFDSRCGATVPSPFFGEYGVRRGTPTIDLVIDPLSVDKNAATLLKWVKPNAGEWWPGGKGIALSRDLVIRLAEAIAREAQASLDKIIFEDMFLGTDPFDALFADHGGKKQFDAVSAAAHAALRQLHRIATDLSVEVDLAEIDQPLSWAELTERKGLVTIVNGEVTLTEKGEELATSRE